MCTLALREVGDCDIHDLVGFLRTIVVEGSVEHGAYGGFGAIDPVAEDTDGLVFGSWLF